MKQLFALLVVLAGCVEAQPSEAACSAQQQLSRSTSNPNCLLCSRVNPAAVCWLECACTLGCSGHMEAHQPDSLPTGYCTTAEAGLASRGAAMGTELHVHADIQPLVSLCARHCTGSSDVLTYRCDVRRLQLNGTLSVSSTPLLRPHLLTAVMRLFPLSSAEVRPAAPRLRCLQHVCNTASAQQVNVQRPALGRLHCTKMHVALGLSDL
jgi:hypothetical protein